MHHKAETAWRIRISTFTGNMLKLQKWFPTFTSCGYEDWKLRLEGCLESEAAETIRGLQYPEVAYNAAKERLVRKYVVDWRVKLLTEGRKKRNLASYVEKTSHLLMYIIQRMAEPKDMRNSKETRVLSPSFVKNTRTDLRMYMYEANWPGSNNWTQV